MALSEQEIERMIVRLMGNGDDYAKMLDQAVKNTNDKMAVINATIETAEQQAIKSLQSHQVATEKAVKQTDQFWGSMRLLGEATKESALDGEKWLKVLTVLQPVTVAVGAGIYGIGKAFAFLGDVAMAPVKALENVWEAAKLGVVKLTTLDESAKQLQKTLRMEEAAKGMKEVSEQLDKIRNPVAAKAGDLGKSDMVKDLERMDELMNKPKKEFGNISFRQKFGDEVADQAKEEYEANFKKIAAYNEQERVTKELLDLQNQYSDTINTGLATEHDKRLKILNDTLQQANASKEERDAAHELLKQAEDMQLLVEAEQRRLAVEQDIAKANESLNEKVRALGWSEQTKDLNAYNDMLVATGSYTQDLIDLMVKEREAQLSKIETDKLEIEAGKEMDKKIEAQQKLAEQAEEMEKSAKETRLSAGMDEPAKQAEKLRVQLEKVKDLTKDQISARVNAYRAELQYADAVEKGKKLTEEATTPFEAYKKKVEELAKIRTALGADFDPTYKRQLKKAQMELDKAEFKINIGVDINNEAVRKGSAEYYKLINAADKSLFRRVRKEVEDPREEGIPLPAAGGLGGAAGRFGGQQLPAKADPVTVELLINIDRNMALLAEKNPVLVEGAGLA